MENKEKHIDFLLQKEQQCLSVQQQLKRKTELKMQQLEHWKMYKRFYVAKKKEENHFKAARSETNKKYQRNKRILKESVVPSAEQLAKKELVKNNNFLKTIRASYIQRDEQLPSCLSPMSKPNIWNAVSCSFLFCAPRILVCASNVMMGLNNDC